MLRHGEEPHCLEFWLQVNTIFAADKRTQDRALMLVQAVRNSVAMVSMRKCDRRSFEYNAKIVPVSTRIDLDLGKCSIGVDFCTSQGPQVVRQL